MQLTDFFFQLLKLIDTLYWEYVGVVLIVMVGIYFTIKSKAFQFKVLFNPKNTLIDLKQDSHGNNEGTDPFKLYFASIGGMLGVGNIAGIVTAVTIGGPGALIWIWVATLAGTIIKYCEIYLGIAYRVSNGRNSYDGGPMYYLQKAFGNRYIPYIVCLLLCIYGAEVYQFTVMTDTVTQNLGLNRYLVLIVFLSIIIYSSTGGVRRLANIASRIMPFFLVLYISLCMWIIYLNFPEFLKMIPVIFESAFNGHAAVGGFAGSSMLIAAQYGTARAVYSGDIGIGYDSIIQSETKAKTPEKQAKIAIFALLSDAIIGTFSCIIVLVSGVWKSTEPLKTSEYVSKVLEMYFPYTQLPMTILITSAALTTITAYLVVGMKCAKFINAKWGEKIYLIYAVFAFAFFSFFEQNKVMLIMSISAGLLTLFNLIGIIKLRNKIKFN